MTVAYVTMPGTSGNNVSSADVNLLDADTAHCYQSFGKWQSRNQADTLTLETAVTGATMGGNVFQFLAASPTALFSVRHSIGTGNGIVLAPSTQYIPAVRARTLGGVARSARVSDMELRNNLSYVAGGGYVGGTVVTLPADGSWVWITGPASTTPASGFDNANFHLNITDAVDNEVYQIDTAVVRQGSTATFVPSLRIVGDLDMRARMTATTATPAAAKTLIGDRSGNSGYAMTLGTGGELVVYHGTGSGTRAETSSGLALVAATDTEVRSVIDISAGTWTHYKNGVQFDTSGSFATTAGSPFTGPLAVGADSAGTSGNWDGDIYYAEVRDGIDGPVVRRFDADDLIGLV